MARPTKATPETIKAICDEIRSGSSQDDAARLSDVNIGTFYRWMNTNREFSDAVQKAHADFKHANVLAIRAAGIRKDKSGDLKGQWQANAWLLERKYSDEFGQKLTIKVTPEQASILKRYNKSASEVLEDFVQSLVKAENEADNG